VTAEKPRIVINALSARRGGGVTYLGNLLRHLARDACADVFVLVAPGQGVPLPEAPYQVIQCSFAGRSVIHRVLWERFAAPRLLARLRADVYYVLSGTLVGPTPPGCKSIVAFRNLLPFSAHHRRLYPPGYMRARLWLLGITMGHSFRNADRLIFVSRHGQQVIDDALPERRGGSTLIPHGVDDAFFATGAEPEGDPRWPGGYVLYVSILDVYKAHEEVLEAWAEVRRRRATPEVLVLAGPEFPHTGRRVRRKIAELGLEEAVVLLGPVPHAELPRLYRGARVNLYASRCENCPNILLEALAAGRPIACSTDPPMPEFGADAVVYFDAGKPSDIARVLCELLDDEARREELARLASEHAESFRLDRAIGATWRCLTDLAGRARAEKAESPRRLPR